MLDNMDNDFDNHEGESEVDSEHEDSSEHDSDDEDVDNSHAAGQKRKSQNKDCRPAKGMKLDLKQFNKTPTAQEISSLKETQMLHHSSLFKMQMEELNENIKMKNKHRVQIESWLIKFREFCKTLPTSSQYSIDDHSWLKTSDVTWPITSHLPDNKKGMFMFAPPTTITPAGSYASHNALRLDPVVDVMVTLPKECLQAQDWLNCRWLKKRCLYLCWLASELRSSDLVSSQDWVLHGDEALRPVLQVTPAENFGTKWKFNLFPIPPVDYFKLEKFSPEKNCIREAWFFNKDGSDDACLPTPHYNRLCAIDVVMPQHQQIINNTFKNNDNLCLGLKLLKTWLNQQQLNNGHGSLINHTLTLYVIHLLNTHKINLKMSGYQVFRTTVLSLSTADWSIPGAVSTKEFLDHYSIVFQFNSECFNSAGSMNAYYFQRLKFEANLALTALDSTATNSFESLFIQKKEFIFCCDQFLNVKLTKKDDEHIFEAKFTKGKRLSQVGCITPLVHDVILNTVKEALGNRVMLFHQMPGEYKRWSVGEEPSQPASSLTCGLYIDPQFSDSLLTKGPSTDFPEEMDTFRKFWGDKSNLRRFQDGSFHEAVLWGETNDSAAKRRGIPGKIVKYILQHHLNLKVNKVKLISAQLEEVLLQPCSGSTGEEETVSAIQAFDSLSRKLRSLDLPLGVSGVQAVSEVVRHAAVFPPQPNTFYRPHKGNNKSYTLIHNENNAPFHTSSIEVLLFLEISGKWPDDIKAIKAMKVEFQAAIAQQLRNDGIVTKCLPDSMLVYLEGYVFNVKVCNRREIYLHRLVHNGTDWEEEDTLASLNLEKEIEIMPKVTSALASIQSSDKNYNSTVRLCKRWVTAQLLSDHLCDVVVELLVASLFKNPAPYTTPHTPQLGLFRFLNLLATTDWSTTALLLNLNHSFSIEDEGEILNRFSSRRDMFPTMMVATPYELRGNVNVGEATSEQLDKRYKLLSYWTRSSPSPVLLYRIKHVASVAVKMLQDSICNQRFNFKCLFWPSFEDYDLLIHIKPESNSRRTQQIRFNTKHNKHHNNRRKKISNIIPVIDYDPVYNYVSQIKNLYKDVALFFYDINGGSKIGVVWNPLATAASDIKISHLLYHQITGVKEKKQIPNIDGIVQTLQILGKGIVASVEWKNK